MIIEIAKKLSFDVRISAQGWGAVLSREPDETFTDLKKNVIIVEMPDVLKEKELQEKGHNLFVLDHHQYPHLKRLYPVSALEQFACLISYTLNRWQMGVALNDRGYIPALRKQGYSEDEILEIRQYDLEAQGYKPEYFEMLRRDYLKGYKKRFGDWTLSAAAYNMGGTRLAKDINTQRATNYYDLSLNSETSRYVFRVIAIKEILKNPRAFGFYLEEDQAYPPMSQYNLVEVNGPVESWGDFAVEHGTTYRMLKVYNPWLISSKLTNKEGKVYTLKIPK
ncbi:MAG: hypothetical protein HUU08_15350 [Candidatus Brocadia sp.]|nr:hypothetical protein [Candidatus Brocadia sp.]